MDGTGYRKLTLTYVGGSGSFADGDELMVMFSPAGQAGFDGPTGADGGITMIFDNPTGAADPGAGRFRLNHATHASATALYIDNADALGGGAIGAWIDSWDDSTATIKGTLDIVSQDDPAIWRKFYVGAVTDRTGYRSVVIAYAAGAGSLADEAPCSIFFSRTGNNGSNGNDGPNGTNGYSPGFRLTFSTTTTDADPGAGTVRFNNGTFGSITQIFVDNAEAGGGSITTWLDGLDDVSNAKARAYLRFEKATDPTVFAEFAVTGAVTDGTGYRKIPVSPISGAIPANATVLVATASKSGADGAASVPDKMKVNDASIGGYQAKSQSGFTGYRRGKNTLWDGFADSSGLNIARCSNYAIDAAKSFKATDIAGTSTVSVSFNSDSGQTTARTHRNWIAAGAVSTSGTYARANSRACGGHTQDLQQHVHRAFNYRTKLRRRACAPNVQRWQLRHPCCWKLCVERLGSLLAGRDQEPDGRIRFHPDRLRTAAIPPVAGANYEVYIKDSVAEAGTQTVSGYTNSDQLWVVDGVEVKSGPGVSNATYSSALQTADAAVTSVTAYFEIDTIDAITLGTDLTGIATCKGGRTMAPSPLRTWARGSLAAPSFAR